MPVVEHQWIPDPATQGLLDRIAAAGIPPMNELGPKAARQAMLDGLVNDVDPPPVAEVSDQTIAGPGGGIALRIYRPRAASAGQLGALLYFHGGGFVIGNLDTHDILCRQLCAGGDVIVIAVDYRLAPEHPFPAAVDDALAAFSWLCEHAAGIGADPQRLAVCGDSAGGTLAAIVARHARDVGTHLRAQLLLYPVTDLAGSYPSHEEQSRTYPIPTQVLDWFWSAYLGPGWKKDTALRRDPNVSPLHCQRFDELAPAFVLTAGLDPLRDEGDAYARRLAGAGVETIQLCAMGTVHGFLRLGRLLPAAGDAITATAGFLRARLAVKEIHESDG
ncbi:MAG: alpha/beta hydrolase [Lysobacterales bacterium]|nr:MAG: alpha/beta hydrolase [Xanthomonadales bacterium]